MTASSREVMGSTLHPGTATGRVLQLDGPLSFWGGVDGSGRIVDRHHPQFGASVRGRVLAMTSGRGSSSSASVLAELLRTGRGPSAIVMVVSDAIVTLGAIVAGELYADTTPVVVIGRDEFERLTDDARAYVVAGTDDATIQIEPDTLAR